MWSLWGTFTIKSKMIDNKLVKNCVKCGNQLRKNSPHHYLCIKCWEKKELERGNLALIGGLPKQ